MTGMLAALCVSSQPGSSLDGAAFREPLEQILRASKERFRRIEGARVENRRRDYYYESKTYLPGAEYCEMLPLKDGRVFHCEWKSVSARTDSATVFDKLASIVEHTLGSDWNSKAAIRKGGKEVEFTRGGEPVIQVINEQAQSLVHLFITAVGSSPERVGETLPRRPPFILP